MKTRNKLSSLPLQSIPTPLLTALCCFTLLIGCNSVPAEEPVHLCAPAGQCPESSSGDSTLKGDYNEGKRLFSLHCMTCHGPNGKGIKPGVGDLTADIWKDKSRAAQIASTIKNGRGDLMPAFALSQQSIAHLVTYVQSLSGGNTY